jgi:hypothetical protein
MSEKKRFHISPIVWIIAIPIISFIIIIFLANGIRQLITPEWFPEKWVTIAAWIELGIIGSLAIVSIICILYLFYLITKFISIDKLEDEFYRIKKNK